MPSSPDAGRPGVGLTPPPGGPVPTATLLSRRRFLRLGATGAGTLAAGAALGGLPGALRAWAGPPLGPTDGVLVVVMLAGGNDGLNTVIPRSSGRYRDLRRRVAVPEAQIVPLTTGVGLHPSLTRLAARYRRGEVAIVDGVGAVPYDLSHFTSMATWMSGWAGSPPAGGPTGWLGRFLDTLPGADQDSLCAAVIGSSVPLTFVGARARASGLPGELSSAFGVDRRRWEDARMFDAYGALGTAPTGLGPWGDRIARTGTEAMDLALRLRPAYQGVRPEGRLRGQLELCARLVNADLGIRVLGTALGGFDTHAAQPAVHAALLAELDQAVEAFFAALAPAWRLRVTLMTFSEFGRRPADNDTAGTDHGTAAPMFLVGARVRPGIHGAPPDLARLDRDGNLPVAVEFRRVYASILEQWFRTDPAPVVGARLGTLPLLRPPGGDVRAGPVPPLAPGPRVPSGPLPPRA